MTWLVKIIRYISSPLVWSGIWKYRPFGFLRKLYERILYIEYKKKSTHIIHLKYGPRMQLHTSSEVVEKSLYFDGEREQVVTKLLLGLIKKWDVVIDVWANIWYYSLIAGHALQWSWHVIWFEPSTVNHTAFQKNISLNNLTNITAVQLGLWSKVWKMDLFFDTKNPWMSSLLDGINNKDMAERVWITTLDAYLWEKNRVDIIKIDVEWHEYEALLGMKNTLEDNDSLHMIREFSPWFYEKLTDDIMTYSQNIFIYLQACGFDEFFHINKISKKIERIDMSMIDIYTRKVIESTHKQSDIYCIKSQ